MIEKEETITIEEIKKAREVLMEAENKYRKSLKGRRIYIPETDTILEITE